MGIGFEAFKANLGWSIADGVMGSISNSIERNAAEKAAREQAQKELQDKRDMLKTLVFMVGNKISLDRSGKKAIASALSILYDENISLFAIEDKIDSTYAELQYQNHNQYFSSIAAINTDRGQTCLMYAVVLLVYLQLSDEGLALPVHAHNLGLIKRYFGINRSELAECYSALGQKLNKDTDDIADVFEELTSEENIRKIEDENPLLIQEQKDDAVRITKPVDNPKKEIEMTYTNSIQGSDAVFRNRFFLADSNPKKVIAAVNAYARGCKGEEIIALYDDSVFNNGKIGFLLTNKKLYINNSFEKPKEIELSLIKSIVAAPKSPKQLVQAIFVNDIKIDATNINGVGLDVVTNFLQKVIPIAMQIEVEK